MGYFEEFTLSEWIFTPISLISIYQWQGESLAVIFAPIVLALAVGLGLMIWWRSKRTVTYTLFVWLGALAGLLFLGTGIMKLLQMIIALTYTSLMPEVGVTLILDLAPILIGILTLRLSLRTKGKVNRRTRIYLGIIGLAALFLWAGLLLGSAIAFIGALLPSRLTAGKS